MSDLVHAKLSQEIIGAAMEVHRTLGSAFVESVFEGLVSSSPIFLRQAQDRRQNGL